MTLLKLKHSKMVLHNICNNIECKTPLMDQNKLLILISNGPMYTVRGDRYNLYRQKELDNQSLNQTFKNLQQIDSTSHMINFNNMLKLWESIKEDVLENKVFSQNKKLLTYINTDEFCIILLNIRFMELFRMLMMKECYNNYD